MAITWPAESIKSVTAHERRANVGRFGFEQIPFVALYYAALLKCYETAGAPYAAALAHHAAKRAAGGDVGVQETEDEWNVPSYDWEPEADPFDDEAAAPAAATVPDGFELEDDAVPPPPPPPLLDDEPAMPEVPKLPDAPLPNPYLPDFWAVLGLVGVVIAHLLLMFAQRWSIGFRCMVQYTRIPRLRAGCYAYVRPHQHQGKAEIVPVQEGEVDGKRILFFMFQRQRFEIDEESQVVRHLESPIDLPLKVYADGRGLRTEDDVVSVTRRFGNNSLNIPLPTFADMYIEQILGPVPVFQVFCTCLWLLDEYWNYALFNLFSIFMFEGTTVFGRLKNVSSLRGLRNKDGTVQVYRCGKWQERATTDMLPGDLFSLSKGSEECVVPCDAVILRGTAVVNEASLTGESTPQMKEAVSAEGALADEKLDINSTHRVHCLYSGTTLMQHTGGVSGDAGGSQGIKTPDGGCLCYCIRTGFSSSQGKLIRMIEYSSEQVTGDAKETLALLFILLTFALLASGYVFNKGLKEGKRSQYELVLRCVLILTSVVPPELPMQTALAVNTALMALWKAQVFCTEPFRIPYAGRVTAALFDKTGTLTTDQLSCVGIVCWKGALSDPEPRKVAPMAESSVEVCTILGGCHALVQVGDQVLGDPVETAALKAIGWEYKPLSNRCAPSDKCEVKLPKNLAVSIMHRFHFASKLQRMSTVARVSQTGSSGEIWALVKGSPEMIATLCTDVPAAYMSTYQDMAENGMRVLALAYKKLEGEDAAAAERLQSTGRGMPREDVESGLTFAGFIAFSCLTRKDTAAHIADLNRGNHCVAMATGDAALTALFVGAQVGITSKNTEKALILKEEPEGSGRFEWASTRGGTGSVSKPFAAADVPKLAKMGYELCVTGPVMNAAAESDEGFWKVMEHIKIFARMSPEDKERVLRALRENGHFTLMCGDGANDVGALKQAHVGLALLSGFGGANTAKSGEELVVDEDPAEKKRKAKEMRVKMEAKRKEMIEQRKVDQKRLQQLQQQFYKEELEKLQRAGDAWASVNAFKPATARAMELQKQMIAERQKKFGGGGALAASAAMLAEDTETGEVPMVKLGDASVAAPFTSKLPSIQSTVDIIRQGRCTLVSTIQMQQILALNCLIAAYSLSALYLDGVRSGEAQMIASGVLLTAASLAFTYARPVQELSPVRPITSIFHPAISLSIVGQILIHLYCMVTAINMAKSHSPDDFKDLEDISFQSSQMGAEEEAPEPTLDDGTNTTGSGGLFSTPFKPSLLNTVVFLIETAQQVSVMAVNYKGRPFMIASTENRPMLYSLAACCAGTFICAFEVIPFLNNKLQLVPLPSDAFRTKLLWTLAASVFGAFTWDRVCVAIFAPRLLITGYVDAWKAMPSWEESGKWWAKAVYIGGAAGLYMATGNIIIPGIAYFVWKRFKLGERWAED